MGKKYVIELEGETFEQNNDPVYPTGTNTLYRVKGFNSLVFDKNGLDKLKELNSDYVNEYFDDLQTEAYHAGLESMWGTAQYLWRHGTLSFDWTADEMMNYYHKTLKENKKSERIKNGNVSALKLYSYIKREINPYGKPFDGTVYEFGNNILDYINDNLLEDESWQD